MNKKWKWLLLLLLGLFLPSGNVFAQVPNMAMTTNGNIYQFIIVGCETELCWDRVWSGIKNSSLIDGLSDLSVLPNESQADNSNNGSENNNESDDAVVPIETAQQVEPLTIRISEIYPVPKTGEKEWVELYNAGTVPVDLTDWRLLEHGGKVSLLSGILEPGNYLFAEKSSLNNDGDTVTLFSRDGVLIDAVSYGDFNNDFNHVSAVPKSGQAIIWWNDNYLISEMATPATANILTEPAEQESENILTPSYFSELTEQINISTVNVLEVAEEKTAQEDELMSYAEFTIRINEALASPVIGEKEWVELFNFGQERINLKNFFLDDEEGGSAPYKIKEDLFIEPQGFAVIGAEETKLAFNNDGDQIRLLSPDGQPLQVVAYGKHKVGQSLAFSDGDYFFVDNPTKGFSNEQALSDSFLLESEQDEVKVFNSASFVVKENEKTVVEDEKTTAKENKNDKNSDYKLSNLLDFGNRVAGEKIEIGGPLLVEPGFFSSKSAYLPGVELYVGKDFGITQARGQLLTVRGEVSEYAEGKRLLMREVVIDEQSSQLDQAQMVSSFSVDLVKYLIEIEGKFLSKVEDIYYFSNEGEEFKVKLNKNITKKFETEKEYKVKGVLLSKKNELVLFPRDDQDIEPLDFLDIENKEDLVVAKTNYYDWKSGSVLLVIILFCLIITFYKVWQRYPHIWGMLKNKLLIK